MGVLLEGKEGPLDLKTQASMPWRTAESVELNGDKDEVYDDSGGSPRVPTYVPRLRLHDQYRSACAATRPRPLHVLQQPR